jgi:hypothetical protein
MLGLEASVPACLPLVGRREAMALDFSRLQNSTLTPHGNSVCPQSESIVYQGQGTGLVPKLNLGV